MQCVRLALGATPSGVLRLVVVHAMRAVAGGIGAGLLLAGVAATTLFSVLPNLEQAERWSALPAVAMLTVVALVAAVIPARRAVQLDPTVALRE